MPGSPIDALDQRSLYKSYRETTSITIVSALDHLRLVTESVLGLKGALPFAHATSLRTALSVSSAALWLMPEEDAKRELRAAMWNFHDHTNYLVWLRLRSDEKYSDIVQHRERIERRRDHFAAVALELGTDVTKRWKLTAEYDMTVAAAKMMDPAIWGDGWSPAVEVPSQWRMLSAYAHGLRWATAPDTVQGDPDENGFAATTLSFSLDRLMESTRITMDVVDTAINRFRVLAGHHC